MGESLMERRRVLEETLRGVKSFSEGTIMIYHYELTSGIRGGKLRALARPLTVTLERESSIKLILERNLAYMLEPSCFIQLAISREVVYNISMRSNNDIISKFQKEIIIGTILGDGSLEFNGFQGTRLQIKQSLRYKDYVFWLYDQLKNLCNSGPKQRKDNDQWYFSTKYLKELTNIYKIFYPNGQKIIPKNISKLLTSSLGLAIWYMDDGSLYWRPKEHNGFRLCTNCFSFNDVIRLKKILYDNFRIESTVQSTSCRGKKYPRIYIGVAGRNNFLKAIKPYILDCFSHKLPPL